MGSPKNDRVPLRDRDGTFGCLMYALVGLFALFIASIYTRSQYIDAAVTLYVIAMLVVIGSINLIDRSHGWMARAKLKIAQLLR